MRVLSIIGLNPGDGLFDLNQFGPAEEVGYEDVLRVAPADRLLGDEACARDRRDGWGGQAEGGAVSLTRLVRKAAFT